MTLLLADGGRSGTTVSGQYRSAVAVSFRHKRMLASER